MTIPYGIQANTPMLSTGNANDGQEKSSNHFSYLIRPTTPCIFGTDNYDEKFVANDEFFLTAGGIVHSCPNIYELAVEDEYECRRLQSCSHLTFANQHKTSRNNSLNTYDTEFNRYSVVPRYRSILSSSPSFLSRTSSNCDIELYEERHVLGLTRNFRNDKSPFSSFLPTTWKSDNYLLFFPVLNHQLSFASTIDHCRRSRSQDMRIRQALSSVYL